MNSLETTIHVEAEDRQLCSLLWRAGRRDITLKVTRQPFRRVTLSSSANRRELCIPFNIKEGYCFNQTILSYLGIEKSLSVEKQGGSNPGVLFFQGGISSVSFYCSFTCSVLLLLFGGTGIALRGLFNIWDMRSSLIYKIFCALSAVKMKCKPQISLYY